MEEKEVSKSKTDEDLSVTLTQELLDGCDSGVEVARALSSNSSNSAVQSCGSSLVSCYSEHDVDRASECGSESSRKTGVSQCSTNSRKSELSDCLTRVSKRRTATASETCSDTSSTYEAVSSARSQDSKKRLTVPKKPSESRNTVKRSESARVRERPTVRSSSSARVKEKPEIARSREKLPTQKPALKPKPDLRVIKNSPPAIDDGRWPSSAQKNGARSRTTSAVDVNRAKRNNIMTSSATSANSLMTSSTSSVTISIKNTEKNSTLDKYATLPRRPKVKKSENLDVSSVQRSSSVSREPSLNRAATLRRQQSKEKEQQPSPGKTLPPYPRSRKGLNKTVIYHEQCVQTALTGSDVMGGLSGPTFHVIDVMERKDKAVQSEGPDRLKQLEENNIKLGQELDEKKKDIESFKSSNVELTKRILKMLGQEPEPNPEHLTDPGTSLEELEKHLQVVGVTVMKQKEEITELRRYKHIAQRDIEKSFAAQKNLLQQQQESEAEFTEIKEFLQSEKQALAEALRETELEIQKHKSELDTKKAELEKQQSECQHMVRLCEQRRQENLSLEAKLLGLEQRSRDVLLQQGAAVSGAAIALSGLGSRLDNLVEQLVGSYNISDKDLEDAVFHNEAYSRTHSDCSNDESPVTSEAPNFGEPSASPKKGTSFLNAVIGAIKNATQSPFVSGTKSPPSLAQTDQNSDSLGLIDSETEPCGLETVLEDLSMPSSPRCTDSKNSQLCHSNSLQNLSNAILARQEVERKERTQSPQLTIPQIEVTSLVDQVIDVDNLVTKLLKVLRLVQIENDVALDQLHDQRVELSERLQEDQILLKKYEDTMEKLRKELSDVRIQLNDRIVKLEEAKLIMTENWRLASVEAQRQYHTIDAALETLQSIQDVVDQCPPLAKLQQDLEDCNFKSASGDDLNANLGNNINNTRVKDINTKSEDALMNGAH